jgi:peptide/nickel transport system substrate-binding protein
MKEGGLTMRSREKYVRMISTIVVLSIFGFALATPVVVKSVAAAEDPVYRMYVGVAQDPDTLNVFAMVLSISYTINFLVYDTLTSTEPNFEPGPQLAREWETSEDNKTWTFYIDENAKWHDNTEVTAEDVEFTFNLILDNPKEAALWYDYLSGVVRVEATDKYVVEIETDVPKATMLTIMVPILPKHIWSEVDPKEIDRIDPWDKNAFPDGPIGSGPLKLVSWNSIAGEILMLKNPDYHIDTVKVDEVFFKCFGDPTVMVTALWTGEIDVAMDVPVKTWDETLKRQDLDGQATAALSFYELGVNCASEAWRENFPKASTNLETTNLSVRQAIAMATNKEDMVSRILDGFAEPGESIIPTATPFWHYYVPEEDRWDYQIAKANELLNSSNYNDRNSEGIRLNESSGEALSFTLYHRMAYQEEVACAISLEASLALIGIEVILKPVSEGILWRAWMNCEYDLFIWGWDTDVDPNFMLSTMTESQTPVDPTDSTKWGDAFWINEEYEQLYLDQQVAVDKYERQAIVHKMQEMLYYHCPYIVLYYPMGLHAYDIVEFTNYPNMVKNPGATPGTMWFFFAVTPSDEAGDENPPYDVYAGADQKCTVGETISFSGSASDDDNLPSELNWTWTFSEPDDTFEARYGQEVSYEFLNAGNVTVTLVVTDPDMLTDSDELTVNVTEMSETAGWLKGRVIDQDSDPLSGVTVNASGAMRTTDSDGSYSMTVEEGDYSLLVTKAGYSSATGDASVAVGEITWANFTLNLISGTLEGVVYDRETSEVVPNATVLLEYGAIEREFHTNALGYYQFLLVPEGVVNVTVSMSGYEDNVTVAVIVAGDTTSHDVYLDAVEDGGGISAIAVAAGIVALLACVVAVAFLLRRKKANEEFPPPGEGGEFPPAT